ncbi:MAG TPA: RNA-binding protein S1 [Clostridiaceae bacterium]|nr:RNA-binding protein S1 [Clostridiaceae bacterium]
MQVRVGDVLEGKVSGITNFGAFVQLPGGKTGLVHISEISKEYVKDVNNHLKEKQTVTVKVMSIDKNGKISLSIKKALEPVQVEERPKPSNDNDSKKRPDAMSFEDKLSKFLKDSDEKLGDLKKNFESKRGGGGYRRLTRV